MTIAEVPHSKSTRFASYGSARWATPKEATAAGLLAPNGVVPGKLGRDYLRHDGPEHVLCFAPTRSGKGVGLVVPSLLKAFETMQTHLEPPRDGESGTKLIRRSMAYPARQRLDERDWSRARSCSVIGRPARRTLTRPSTRATSHALEVRTGSLKRSRTAFPVLSPEQHRRRRRSRIRNCWRNLWRTRRDSNPWPLPSEGSALSS